MSSLVCSCCYDSDKAPKFPRRRHGDVLENTTAVRTTCLERMETRLDGNVALEGLKYKVSPLARS